LIGASGVDASTLVYALNKLVHNGEGRSTFVLKASVDAINMIDLAIIFSTSCGELAAEVEKTVISKRYAHGRSDGGSRARVQLIY
jgi:hypothetical protein